VLLLFNMVLLVYIAWVKHRLACSTCGQLVVLPVDNVTVALIGALASLVLFVLTTLSGHTRFAKVFALALATGCTWVSLYLQIFQFRWQAGLCPLCLVAALNFLAVLVMLVYTVIWLES